MDNNENKKETGKFSSFLQKASDAGKRAAEGIQKGAKDLSDKAKEDSYNRRMKKYNPLSAKEFKSKNFNLPNIIEIVDEAGRRDIDVCVDKNAIGWIGSVKDVEVLYLYDEFVASSGITFVPVAKCDEIYCVDSFDRNKYISAGMIFSKTNEEKIAELEHIAYDLGAKSCSIEMVNANSEGRKNSVGISANIKNEFEMPSDNNEKKKREKLTDDVKVSASVGRSTGSLIYHKGKKVSHFNGSDEPKQPTLKWFAYDDNVKGLIEMRCTDKNSIKSMVMELDCASCATMNIKTAIAIDKMMKVGSSLSKVGGSISMEAQSKRESCCKLIFDVEF